MMSDVITSAATMATPALGVAGFAWARLEKKVRGMANDIALCKLREQRETHIRAKHVEVIDILIDEVEVLSPDATALRRAKRILKRLELPEPNDELSRLAIQIDAIRP